MSSFSIRRAGIDDAKEIARVHVASWQETYKGLMPDSVLDTLSVERRSRQWEQSLEDPTDPYHLTFVALVNSVIVGFANYGKEREGDSQYQGELYAIYLLKEFHGRGIGRALVQASASGLLDLNISSMLVWVLSDNPSREFYEKMGGKYVREKTIEYGGLILNEKAYGWDDVHVLF